MQISTHKTIGKILTFRPSKDVQVMLQRAIKDHPIISGVINECLRRQLTASGYARKKETAV
jgi:hypothetical protein